MAGPPLRLFVGADVMTHEMMRFALKEIVRRAEDDPYGFTAADAAAIAAASLVGVADAEAKQGLPHA